MSRIAGGTNLLSKHPNRFSEGVWPTGYLGASGVEVRATDGKTYIDMSIGGMGATVLGYADPDVDEAVVDAIGRGVASSLLCPEEEQLAEVLCDLHPWADLARFTRSGGEAMAVAVRIARASTKRDIVAVCGYHGWHDWYLAANLGATSALDGHLLPGLDPLGVPSVLRGTCRPFRFNDIESLVQIVHETKGQLAAIVLEPYRSRTPSPDFLLAVRRLADASGAVLIVDEISAGFRLRTGGTHALFGPEGTGLLPDLAVFAKALGNGYPIGAVIGRGAIMHVAERCFISSTCWSERTGPVAALAMIDKHQRLDVGAHLCTIGTQVQQGWRWWFGAHTIPITVSGMPPISHFAFQDQAAAPGLLALFTQLMLAQGFLAGPTFYPMYAHRPEHVTRYLLAVESVCAQLADAIAADDVVSRLRGQPATLGFGRLA